jgi:hypothetical protein
LAQVVEHLLSLKDILETLAQSKKKKKEKENTSLMGKDS